ncbi:HD-GYP domain-containing protein [Candidatus Desantisbacteria bacterium]|nr:HD-GYP domain-containing protein [Candidatus Desantisbacteria bacterium]
MENKDRMMDQLIKELTESRNRITELENFEIENKLIEKNLKMINKCLQGFCEDPLKNINQLTCLCGELMGATCALYNRIDKGMLYSWGQWHTPGDYCPVDKPEGHICYDVIKNKCDDIMVIRNLSDSIYAKTDPNVIFYKLKTYVGQAVKFNNTSIGSLCVVYQKDFIPNNSEKKIFGIISAAIGVEENSRQGQEDLKETLEKLRKALGGVIEAMSLTIELRDPYTAGHQKRVSDLARMIAKEMGLSKEKIEAIRMAGAIHDIGKISVPSEILSKPGKLNDLEMLMIKTHPKIGFDILKPIEFPWSVADIILQHHERLDGSGYPLGLKGEHIVLEAKILGVADVVEAMSSHRPYRPGHGIGEALEEISKNKGILYEPTVVDICWRLFTSKKFKFEKK